MEYRQLGRTGIQTSVLSFGCGAVGGLMTKGDPKDQERAVARALEMGITYFDTASIYGNGTSEENLGRVLAKLKPDVLVATKFRLKPHEHADIPAAIRSSLEASLKRLKCDSVGLFQLHNRVTAASGDDQLSVEAILGEVAPTLRQLREEGKIRHLGITALGETPALHRVIASGAFDTAQICFNALNPTAGVRVLVGYPAQDYELLLQVAHEAGMGTIGIRVLAGGALSGSADRHPLNMQNVAPIGSATDFTTDVVRARRFQPLVDAGYVANLPELALRFAISHPSLSTTLVGLANIDQLETAFAAVEKGPLPQDALSRLQAIRSGFAGEPR